MMEISLVTYLCCRKTLCFSVSYSILQSHFPSLDYFVCCSWRFWEIPESLWLSRPVQECVCCDKGKSSRHTPSKSVNTNDVRTKHVYDELLKK